MKYRDWQPDSFFLGYQRNWINDPSIFKLMEKSRQIGLTWSTAYCIVRRALQKKTQTWISSRDELMARLFKIDCQNWAEVLQSACIDIGEVVINEKDKISALLLTLANGSEIFSLSSNPNAQAGKRGNRVADEFALQPDPKLLYDITEPGLTWGGVWEIISTHRGSQNFFNKLIEEARYDGNPKNISLHRVTLQDALEYGFLVKLKSKLSPGDPRLDMDEAEYFDWVRSRASCEEAFRQEYMCEPADDASAFIDYALLDSCSYQRSESWAHEIAAHPDKNYYMGMDIGRTKDLTCLWLAEAEGNNRLTRKIQILENTKFSEQRENLYGYLQLPNVKRCCIDASGLGRQLAEEAHERFGSKVEPVVFTNGVKEDLALSLKRSMEDGYFKLPQDKHIEADFRGIKKTTTSAGNIRFDGERNSNGHSDRFWAAALCIMAAKPSGTGEVRRMACSAITRKKRKWKGLRA